MRYKNKTQSKKDKLLKDKNVSEFEKSIILNPELNKHRQMFLGKPGSKKWHEYYEGLIEIKRKLFKEESVQDKFEKNIKSKSIQGNNQFEINRQLGGDPNQPLAGFIKKMLFALANAPNHPNLNTSSKSPGSSAVSGEKPDIFSSAVSGKSSSPVSSAVSGKSSSAVSGKSSSPVSGAVPGTGSIPGKGKGSRRGFAPVTGNNGCGVKFGWLIELFDNPSMTELLGFAKTAIDSGKIKFPDKWRNTTTKKFDPNDVKNIIKDKNKGPCNAEDIKIDYIPFFLKVYMFLIENMGDVVKRKNNKDLKLDPKLENEMRSSILFSINLLRIMNMYANPTFFDDLYYYYYFLSLDKVFPKMDDFFRMFDTPDPTPSTNNNNSKVNVKLRAYEQFPSDNPGNDKRFGYEIFEESSNSETNFDWFLNLVRLHPEFDYKLPVFAEVGKDFLFEEVPVDGSNNPTGSKIARIQVVNPPPPKQKGGGILESIYSTFGFSASSGTYKYLDDSPLARNFEDVLKDENDNYSGNVHLCIYTLDQSCDFDGNGVTPFLKFIATKNGDKWSFPSFQYTSLPDHEQNNSSFKCELYGAIMDTLELRLCDEIIGGAENNNPPPPLPSPLPPQTETLHPLPSHLPSPLPPQTETPPPLPTEETHGETETPQQETHGETHSPHQLEETPSTHQLEETPSPQQPGETPSPHQLEETPSPHQPGETPSPHQLEETPSPQQLEETPTTEQHTILPLQINTDAKPECSNLESNLDPMFIGLVAQEIDGVRQIFAFLNYDYLETIVRNPENAAQSGVVFCRNDGTELYPITDANPHSKLKWATVDELIFEKKILTEEVDPTISKMFVEHDNLWNIQDMNHNYVDFPFVVYAITPEYKTVTIEDDIATFLENGKIEEYGMPENPEDKSEIGDEYDARYCFTLEPISPKEQSPRRIAMFAWKPRYVVTEEQVGMLDSQTGGNADEEPSLDEELNPSPQPRDSNGVQNDKIALAKLRVPTIYTITKNEHTNNSPVVMWGVLNSKQFAAL